MTRLKVWKNPSFGSRPWCATHPDAPSSWRLCGTWQEAMEYVADALTNPLPLELEYERKEPLTVTYDNGYVFITDEWDGEQVILYPHHWRPLANALTRLADKEGIE